LRQAEQELLTQELEITRLLATLQRLQGMRLALHPIVRPTPLAFPLMVERLREKLSNESLTDRIARMVAQLEKAAGGESTRAVLSVDAIGQNLGFGRESAIHEASASPTGSDARPRRSYRGPRRR
jgi:ATP-dependent helicase Lhr and Lhr-like helicase